MNNTTVLNPITPESFEFKAYILHGLLLSCTISVVVFWFVFNRYRRFWMLFCLNLLNICGVICLLLESVNYNIGMNSWLFAFFSVFHYLAFFGILYVDYRHRHICFFGTRLLNCLNMFEMRRGYRWNCCTWRRRRFDDFGSQVMLPMEERLNRPPLVNQNCPSSQRIRLLFANECIFRPVHKKSFTGSLELPTQQISINNIPLTELFNCRRKSPSAPDVHIAISDPDIYYTLVTQSSTQDEPTFEGREQTFLNISNELINTTAWRRHQPNDSDEQTKTESTRTSDGHSSLLSTPNSNAGSFYKKDGSGDENKDTDDSAEVMETSL